MKVTEKNDNGFSVILSKGMSHGTKIPPLACDMIHLALKEVGISEGNFGYQVTGVSPSLNGESIHLMRVESARGRVIRVHMKCGKSAECTVTGLLRFPQKYELQWLFDRMKTVAQALNETKWASLWPKGSANEAVESTEAPPVVEVPQTPAASETEEEHLEYALLVLEFVKMAFKSHLFSTQAVMETVYAHFQDRSRHGLLMGVLFKLRKLGWVARVKTDTENMWQVTEVFLQTHEIALDGYTPLVSVPLGWEGKTSKRVKKAVKTAKKILPPAPSPKKPSVRKPTARSSIARLRALKEKEESLESVLEGVKAEIKGIMGSLTREELLAFVLSK